MSIPLPDPAQISQLAQDVTTILSPYLPALLAAGSEMTKGALNKLGEIGIEGIWNTLRPKAETNQNLKRALERVAARPEDVRVKGALEAEIEDVLQDDPPLAAQMSVIINNYHFTHNERHGGIEAETVNAARDVAGSITKQNEYNAKGNIYNYYLDAPGDALLNHRAFEQTLENYLGWVLGAYGSARLFGLESLQVSGERPARKLSDVFVPITLRRFQPPPREVTDSLAKEHQDHFDRARAMLEWIEQNKKEGDVIEPRQLLTVSSRLAVIGGAGSGKSTLLSYYASSLALKAIRGDALPFELPSETRTLVPLIIPLRDLREYQTISNQAPTERLQKPRTGDLAGFIPWYLERRYPAWKYAQDFFDRLLLGGGCLVMLDGLDEVVTRSDRARVRAQVEEFANATYPKNLYLVTARETGYDRDAVFGNDFIRHDVQPLEPEQIKTLVTNWCLQLFPNKVQDSVDELTKAIHVINQSYLDKKLPPLITSPLMTTMVVSVRFGETSLPNERAKLYEAAVRVILQAQYIDPDKARDDLVDWGGPWEDQRDWLMELALEMQRGGRAGAAIPDERVREILRNKVPADQLDQFIKTVRGRGGLFEERAELFQFIHLTFQEFLAARKIAKDREEALAGLAPRVKEGWWREVMLLIYGFAKTDHKPFAQQYLDWLSGLESDDSAALAGLELAGAALLETESPDPTYQKAMAQQIVASIENPKLDTPATLRANAADTLARLGDPRPGIHVPALIAGDRQEVRAFGVEDLLWCQIPAGPFWMGSSKNAEDKHYDPEAYAVEVGQTEKYKKIDKPFYISRYPITNAQFDVFLGAADGFRKSKWWEGLARTDNTEPPPKYGGVFDLSTHPVIGVTWYQAVAFSRWLNQSLSGRDLQVWTRDGIKSAQAQTLFSDAKSPVLRLPTEAEWEKAARGPNGKKYPWDGGITPEHANYGATGIGTTSAVGSFPKGMSEYGVLDASGNVWEWTLTKWTKNYLEYDSQEDNRLDGDSTRVVRGGAFGLGTRLVRCAFRFNVNPDYRIRLRGFRVVVAPV